MPLERESQAAANDLAEFSLDDETTNVPPLRSVGVTRDGVPILAAYREDGRLWVWCDHERVWHRHGAGPDCGGLLCSDEEPCEVCRGAGDGHRVAHCWCERSPYRKSGYVLVEVGPLDWEAWCAHTELDSVQGCRWDSCRLDREAYAELLAHPARLADPKQPLAVARRIASRFTDLDYAPDPSHPRASGLVVALDEDGQPALDEDGWKVPDYVALRELDDLDLEVSGLLEYARDRFGPLTLRRWRGAWMRWQRTHWAEVEDAELLAELYSVLGAAWWAKRTAKGPVCEPWNPTRSSVGELVAALEGLVLLSRDTESPAWIHDGAHRPQTLIACRNGLLDPVSGDLHAHDPDWFNQVAVPLDYDAHAWPERWATFLGELWPDDPEAVSALQEWFGYVLSGRTDLQKMLLLVGPPRSGKGTIARILTELVGRGNHAGPTLASLATNFGLQPLIGKPLAVVADARLGGKDTHVVVERLLSISGEDSLTVDRKYREPWTGRLPARLMVLSNELPHFGDASGAIATRFVALTLTSSWLGREDPGLTAALREELPGILRWSLEGLRRLDRQRRFTEPASSVDAVVTMQDAASPTGAFVRDRCQVGPGHEVPAQQLYAAWRGWCYENGRDNPGSEQTLGRTLRSVVPALRVARPRDEAGQRVRMYQGISLGPRWSASIPIVSQGFAVPSPTEHVHNAHMHEYGGHWAGTRTNADRQLTLTEDGSAS